MVEHTAVNRLMRVRFPRRTFMFKNKKLSNIRVLYLFAKQIVWVRDPSQPMK